MRIGVVIAALTVVLAACADDSLTTTTATAVPVSTSTTSIPTTTTSTTEPSPCPSAFCVVYHLHPDAMWSDGIPVTSEDFLVTYELLMDPIDGPADKSGYELITDVVAFDAKTVLVAFSEVYGPWQTLFPTILPEHIVDEGLTAEVLDSMLRTTAGPFVLEEWVGGERIVLRRNPAYWSDTEPISGEAIGDVSEIRLVFPASVRDVLQGLQRGDIDVITPRPLDWIVGEVGSMEQIEFELTPGPFWEHIDFNHDDPLLSQIWIRDVIDLALDRQAIIEASVRRVDPSAPSLDNTVFPLASTHYEAHYSDRYDPVAAEKILQDHFCEKGDDGVYTCQGRRLAFTWATTVGDDYRTANFETAQEFLGAVGIEVTGQFVTPSELFSSEVFFGGPDVWQIINFAWKMSADPHLGNSTYSCSGSAPSGFGAFNVNRYCNETVDSLIASTASQIDEEQRAMLYNQADALYLEDLALIPLYQKPVLMAWSGSLIGPKANISRSTDLWNAGAWAGMETVVVALDSEPDMSNPLLPVGDELGQVIAPLLQGVFGVNPEMEFVPVLIESAESIVSDS